MEKIKTPNHYKIDGINTMEVVTKIVEKNAQTTEETIYLFNTLKYLIRYKNKNGKEDLLKAYDYLQRLININ